MNMDLEATLAESKAEFDELVAKLRTAPSATVGGDFRAGVMAAIRRERTDRRRWWIRSSLAAAAALVLLLAAGAARTWMRPVRTSSEDLVACQRADGTFTATSAAPYVQAFAVTVLARDPASNAAALDSAVRALVRTQNAEGGWSGDELSARNVEALRLASAAGVADATRAYKRGLRYLRMHGIGELSSGDLARAARGAVARLNRSSDRALADCVAICAAQL